MKTFRYTARDIKGTLSKGTMDVESADEVYQKLRDQGLYCISLETKQEKSVGTGNAHMKIKDVSLFCRQLSTMLSAGLMVVRALDILYSRTTNRRLRESYLQLYEDIQKGLSLYEALRGQGTFYPTLLLNMVRAGEMSGTLDSVMQKMSDHYEREYRLVSKMRASMAYPILLLCVTIAVMIGLFVFVLPNFFTMFEGASLPPLTKIVMGISHFLTYQWYIPIIVVFALVFLWMGIRNMRTVRLTADRMKLSLPLFGKQFRIIYVARFTHALSVLYSSGIQMIDAVEMAVSVLNNAFISERFGQVLEDISRGEMLSSSIEKTKLFDTLVTSMIFIGEESGSLDQMLTKLSSFYDNESETALQKMASLIEPVMLIFIAIVIGLVVAAVIVPVYGMYSTVI